MDQLVPSVAYDYAANHVSYIIHTSWCTTMLTEQIIQGISSLTSSLLYIIKQKTNESAALTKTQSSIVEHNDKWQQLKHQLWLLRNRASPNLYFEAVIVVYCNAGYPLYYCFSYIKNTALCVKGSQVLCQYFQDLRFVTSRAARRVRDHVSSTLNLWSPHLKRKH